MNQPPSSFPHASEALDLATLRATGGLDAAEEARFVAHLEGGCEDCTAVWAEARRASDALLLAPAAVSPPAGLRDRLLRRVADEARAEAPAQPWKHWGSRELAGLFVQGAHEGDWEPTATPGVDVKKLWVDEAVDQVTMLVRMAPGSAYPPHRHGGTEQCLVLQGELDVDGEALRAGDFQVAPAGSDHGVQSTREGCLLLIVSSRDDEFAG